MVPPRPCRKNASVAWSTKVRKRPSLARSSSSARRKSVMSCMVPNIRRGRPGVAPRDVALAVHDAHLPVGVHHAVFDVVARAAAQRFGQRRRPRCLIVGVNDRAPLRVPTGRVALVLGPMPKMRIASGDSVTRPVTRSRSQWPTCATRCASASRPSLARRLRSTKRLVRPSARRRPISCNSRSSSGSRPRAYEHWCRPNAYG